MPCNLSFEDSTLVPNVPKKTCQYFHGEHSQEKPQNIKPKKGRSCSQTHEHIMAERKRRENITKMFIALSALIPGLKKMDKASVLSTAIEYVKHLQQRVKVLEQEKKRKIETIGCFKTNKTNVADDYVSCTYDVLDDKPIKICPKVEARVSGKDVLIKVMCEKQKGIVGKLLAKVEAHDLSVVCTNVLPFGNSALIITTIAKVHTIASIHVKKYILKLNKIVSPKQKIILTF
uniref:Transcription factor bHLH25 n=1 Tax=Cajanus cajan TaxID=3821 RepID=A0A151R4X4_CAJCA|nr:Transcription factor bHLH25 [Cajanus cajan]